MLLNGTLITHCHASEAGTVGVADGSALVADAARAETLAQASTVGEAVGVVVAGLVVVAVGATVADEDVAL